LERLRTRSEEVERVGSPAAFETTVRIGMTQLGFGEVALVLSEESPDRYLGQCTLASGLRLEVSGGVSRLGEEEGKARWTDVDLFVSEEAVGPELAEKVGRALGGFALSGDYDWQFDQDLKRNLLESERLYRESAPRLDSLGTPAPALASDERPSLEPSADL